MVSTALSSAADLLERGLVELGLAATPPVVSALAELALLLDSWAARINLTGHRDPDTIVRRLILDAAALHQVLPESRSLVDLGSGAGFPGLPLAILAPTRSVVLVEARRRRHHFQRAAARHLRLANVDARLGRLDELAPVRASLVVAQALGPRSEVTEWMLPWVEPGGWLAVPGSAESAAPAPPSEALAEQRTSEYRVPLGGPIRSVWLGRRSSAVKA